MTPLAGITLEQAVEEIKYLRALRLRIISTLTCPTCGIAMPEGTDTGDGKLHADDPSDYCDNCGENIRDEIDDAERDGIEAFPADAPKFYATGEGSCEKDEAGEFSMYEIRRNDPNVDKQQGFSAIIRQGFPVQIVQGDGPDLTAEEIKEIGTLAMKQHERSLR